jgi:hypothetical protein
MPTASVPGRNDVELEPQLVGCRKYIARVERFYSKVSPKRKSRGLTEQFGRIAHVWSTYESVHDLSDPDPFMRGNSTAFSCSTTANVGGSCRLPGSTRARSTQFPRNILATTDRNTISVDAPAERTHFLGKFV